MTPGPVEDPGMRTSPGTIPSWIGTEVRDHDGHRVGRVGALEFDPATARPTAVVVTLDDGSQVRVSVAGMRRSVDHVVVSVALPVLAAAA